MPIYKISGIIFLIIFCFFKGTGQDFSYRHYDIKDGLVGNHVYYTAQDREGFLWFATETGVSRFDGTRFRNFTTTDGLPDNEVIKLFVDSKGRVWMIPFTNSICYYYKGVIHHPGNDSLLAGMKLKSHINSAAEDEHGNIILLTLKTCYVLRPDGRILTRKFAKNDLDDFIAAGTDKSGNISLVVLGAGAPPPGRAAFYSLHIGTDSLQLLLNTSMPSFGDGSHNGTLVTPRFFVSPAGQSVLITEGKLYVHDAQTGAAAVITEPAGISSYDVIRDSIFFINTGSGVYCFDHKGQKLKDRFLEKENISHSLQDSEGNLWFTSLGNGIWRLNSAAVRNIDFSNANRGRQSVNAIMQFGNELMVGCENNKGFLLDAGTAQPKQELFVNQPPVRRHLKILTVGNKIYYLTELGLYIGQTPGTLRGTFFWGPGSVSPSMKDIDIKADGSIAISYNSGVYISEESNGRLVSKSFITGRTTAVAYMGNTLYTGTLGGLRRIAEDGTETDLSGWDPLLANRITRLLCDGKYLWIGTNNGVVCFDGKKVIKSISAADGLTGNIIRTMHLSGHFLWVGTDRGLNKIDISEPGFPVKLRYTIADGLASNMINAVFVNGNKVYVGTPEGLSFFEEDQVSAHSRCDLRILGITVSGKEMQYSPVPIKLKHRDNNIRFDFVAISYKSSGDIVYHYKLSGLDDDWHTTTENYLQYPTLPSGNYRFEIQATNKFGVKSEVISIEFEVAQMLTEKTWFRILLLLTILGLTWWIATIRIKRMRKREHERIKTISKIAELEQQALKAQMNPHFIFNCLNSIQQYVIDKDVGGANRLISGFAKLIRQTLDNSGRQFISVQEERDFLRLYLDLEKNRFEDRFDYVIRIDEHINTEEVLLPPMLLQPYVENSLRHGLRLKKDGKGMIEINLSLWNNQLTCSIIDNGVGRKAAEDYKSARHIEYQSKGISLTGQRIAMLNTAIQENITVTIEDLYDNDKRPLGTRVIVTLPLNYNMKKL